MREIIESKRREEASSKGVPWKKWGPYLSERQWGTVREDYSESGDAWGFFTHDHARFPSVSLGRVVLRRYLADAFNSPSFSSIFKPGILQGDPNAVVSAQMSEMSGNSRGLAS